MDSNWRLLDHESTALTNRPPPPRPSPTSLKLTEFLRLQGVRQELLHLDQAKVGAQVVLDVQPGLQVDRQLRTKKNQKYFFIISFLPAFLLLVFQPCMSELTGLLIGARQPNGLDY